MNVDVLIQVRVLFADIGLLFDWEDVLTHQILLWENAFLGCLIHPVSIDLIH